jgi:CheY-like chemotaxis protein
MRPHTKSTKVDDCMGNPVILVVDDEPGFRQILSIVLRKGGYRPVLAEDVRAARAVLDKQHPHAIILDDNMPHVSGGDYCYELKQSPLTAHIPIVMYSAGTRLDKADYVQHIGANAVVKKPSMPNDLLDALRRVMEQQASV